LTNCDHPHLRFGTCFDIWRATNATYLLTYRQNSHKSKIEDGGGRHFEIS